MSCPQGYHQHQTSRGVMSQCHRISEKHENAETQRYHEMALAGGQRTEQELSTPTPSKPLLDIPPEQREKIKQNKAKIKRYIKTLQSSQSKVWRNLLGPTVCLMWAYEGMYTKANELSQKAKSNSQKKLVDAYRSSIADIVESLPDPDVSKFPKMDREKQYTEDDLKQLREQQKQVARELIEEIQSQQQAISEKYLDLQKKAQEKGKQSIEYAQYRAYKDYMTMCNTKALLLSKMANLKPPMEVIFSEIKSKPTTSNEQTN